MIEMRYFLLRTLDRPTIRQTSCFANRTLHNGPLDVQSSAAIQVRTGFQSILTLRYTYSFFLSGFEQSDNQHMSLRAIESMTGSWCPYLDLFEDRRRSTFPVRQPTRCFQVSHSRLITCTIYLRLPIRNTTNFAAVCIRTRSKTMLTLELLMNDWKSSPLLELALQIEYWTVAS
jgi:hypothetical protein